MIKQEIQNNHVTDVDIAICGAGPVGLCLAALLVKYGIAPTRIALIDGKTIDQSCRDPRSLALSYGSHQILQKIDAWPLVNTEIHQIHVSRRSHFGRTLIKRDEYGLPALGYVTRYGALITALTTLPALAPVQMLRAVQVTASKEHHNIVELQLSNNRTLTATIMVQAEGSLLKQQTRQQRDYQQIAIVAHIKANTPIAHRAFERFTAQGPLALLPQDDVQGNNYALVWCVRPDTANTLLALDDAAFLEALTQAFGNRLGRFVQTSTRHHFPLGLNTHPTISAHTVTIGNAAQTLHPVAGQGLNLGLRDAMILAGLLAQEISPAVLQHFARVRKTDRTLTICLTDAMARLFTSVSENTCSQTWLGVSLGLIDIINPTRHLLAQHMIFGQR